MTSRLEQTSSVWMQSGEILVQGALAADVEADVCVIGAGIAGMTTAYLLLKEGRTVVVLDDGPIGGGQTERTTAHLTNAIDDRYVSIENWHGSEGARLAAENHSAAIDRIEVKVARENVACDFERLDGYLFSPPGEAPNVLEQELHAARRAGLSRVELVPRCPLSAFNSGACLRFPRQGQFHPRKYLTGLTTAILRMGGRIFTQTHVEKIAWGPPAHVKTRQGLSAGREECLHRHGRLRPRNDTRHDRRDVAHRLDRWTAESVDGAVRFRNHSRALRSMSTPRLYRRLEP